MVIIMITCFRLAIGNVVTSMKSTSRLIFEKVLICIERGICSVNFKEINFFENFIF